MTARHPIHTGMWQFIIDSRQPYGLGLDEKLLPQYLKELNYTTQMVGKWHLGFFREEYTPTFRGFDQHYGYFTGQLDYWTYWHKQFAVQVIENHDISQPLFLYLAQVAPHGANEYDPMQAPQETIDQLQHIENENRRTFAELDTSIGEIISALAAKGMLDNSIVVLSTDNGGAAAGFNLQAASNWPLRGNKDTIWQAGVRGTACIWSPLLPANPRVSLQVMHVQDWLPTLLGALGEVPNNSPHPLDGVNAWGALTNPDEFRSSSFVVHVTSRAFKPSDSASAYRGHAPAMNNLAAREPEILNQLMTILEAHNATLVPSRKEPVDPECNPKYYNDTWVS
ncbi:hypothetical protein B566_EDAN015458, partial [Ephemera danica]